MPRSARARPSSASAAGCSVRALRGAERETTCDQPVEDRHMASMWRKAMLYLGLGPDDEYDDFDVTGEHQRAARPARRAPEVRQDAEPSGSVRTLTPADDAVNGHAGAGRNGIDGDRVASAARAEARGER